MQGLGINDMHVPAPLPGPTAMVKRRSLDRDPETSCSDVEPPRSRTSSLGADPLDSSASASARTPPEFRLIRLHNSSSQNTLNEVQGDDTAPAPGADAALIILKKRRVNAESRVCGPRYEPP
ncbi:unnamed protein product [Bemisia tabaci]|uniref:Uncharacterized protein n=1 Tax=Bemisia tabaci TaxID=7038 RepID=A0A9P0F2S3_BEMTA|nr:unnamed protein product [Bemisia tabaci]